MKTKQLTALAISCLILIIATTTPASALPPKGGDRPVKVTSLPPLQLEDFTVTTDSVVATAKVTQHGAVKRVTIRWGDGSESTSNPGGTLQHIVGVQTGPVFTFQHIYTSPENGLAFNQFVTASVEAPDGSVDVEVLGITITPRYEVTQYNAFFAPLSHCESIFETYSEWQIRRSMDGKKWRQDRITNGGVISYDPRVLDDSMIRKEMLMSDPHLYVSYKITELDSVWDDSAGTRSLSLHPSVPSGKVRLYFNDDCEAEITADVEVKLLKPGLLPYNGPVFSPAG